MYIKPILIIALLFFIGGCSGETITGEQAGDKAVEEAKEPSGSSILEEVKATLNGPTGKHKVSYEIDYGNGEKVEVTTYFMDDNNIRVDMTSLGEISRTYFIDGTTSMCTENEEGFTCLTVPPSDFNNPEENVEYNIPEDDADAGSYSLARDGSIQVSGHTARCYKSEYQDASQRFCFSVEGVLLYSRTIQQGETIEFSATAYSTDVKESDFELPGGIEVIDLNQELQNLQEDIGNKDAIGDMDALGGCYSDCDSKYGDNLVSLEGCYSSCSE